MDIIQTAYKLLFDPLKRELGRTAHVEMINGVRIANETSNAGSHQGNQQICYE